MNTSAVITFINPLIKLTTVLFMYINEEGFRIDTYLPILLVGVSNFDLLGLPSLLFRFSFSPTFKSH
jgi:hypothetical protein